jgi:endonuclease/exonuclease/phosphatase family metal-dependent hydrolase
VSFIIGSFNIQDFTGDGKYRKRGTPDGVNSAERDISKIAEMIETENFDIIALQEIRDYGAVDLLKKSLGNSRWMSYCNYDKAKPCDNTKLSEPEFAFLWKSNTMSLCRDINDEPIVPIFIENCRGSFKRLPYYGRFTSKIAPKVEIRLINVHLKSGQGKQTKEEFALLSSDVYRCISSERDGRNMDVYTFILGDYNLTYCYCNGCEVVSPDTYLTNTSETMPTRITKDRNTGEIKYSSDLDHFGYEKKNKKFIGRHINVNRCDVPNNDFKKYIRSISDHVPIKLELNINVRGL